jgi:hypothetical protein
MTTDTAAKAATKKKILTIERPFFGSGYGNVGKELEFMATLEGFSQKPNEVIETDPFAQLRTIYRDGNLSIDYDPDEIRIELTVTVRSRAEGVEAFDRLCKALRKCFANTGIQIHMEME